MEENTLRTYFSMLLKAADEFRKLMRPFSIDKMAGHYSKRLDELILRTETEQKLHYIGGEFIVTAVTAAHFKLAIDLYFRNEENEWVRVQTESGLKDMRYLNETSRRELQGKKKIIFEVQEPSRDVNRSASEEILPRRK